MSKKEHVSAERRSSADLIAGILLSDCRFARFDMFTVRLARQILSRDFSVTVHQDELSRVSTCSVLHDKRLYDVVFIHTETRGCLSRAAVFQ